MKKSVIITFDYEVFLGQQTGTIMNCVIKPTQLILEILKKNNAKAIFFVDATWLLFLKDYSPYDFKSVSNQLEYIINTGSSVELHLHPQWAQAYKINDKIGFRSFENYKLHSLGEEEIIDLFRRSTELLESITSQKICCFRAGGFCIEPFVQIKNAFESFKIKYDFSVTPGMRLNDGNVYDFDFYYAPNLPFYPFNYNVTIPESRGPFIEIPLSTYNNNPIYRLVNKFLLTVINDKIYGDGKGIHEKSFGFINSLNRRLNFSKSLLSLDKTYHIIFKYLLVTHFRNKVLNVIISHPKLVSKQSLVNLSYLTKNFKTLNSFDLNALTIL